MNDNPFKMPKGSDPWYDGVGGRSDAADLALRPLLKRALFKEGEVTRYIHKAGATDPFKMIQQIESRFRRVLGTGWSEVVKDCSDLFFVGEHTAVNFVTYRDGIHNLNFVTNDPDDFTFLQLLIDTISAIPQPGAVYAITRPAPDQPLGIIAVGNLNTPIERGNYTDEVLASYDRIVVDLQRKSPRGRISLFEGPPGTGKTYLLQGLLSSVPKTRFVIVPSTMVGEIGGPEILNILAQQVPDCDRTVLVVEDADDMLAKRDASNMSTLAAALNIGDGLLGKLFQIHIVATCNTPITEIDEALTRKGRMNEHVHVDYLDLDKATQVLKRLLPNLNIHPQQAMTIADIYSLARDHGWEEPIVVSNNISNKSERPSSPPSNRWVTSMRATEGPA